MKDLKLLEKICSLLGRKKGDDGSSSAFSRKMQQQSPYTAALPGAKTGGSKKSLLRKWQDRLQQKSQQRLTGPRASRNEKRIHHPLRLLVLATLLLVLAVLVTGPVRSSIAEWRYFRIHEIEISGCRVTSAKKLKEFAGISYEMHMLSLDPREIERRLQEHPWIASADIRRVWPDSLAIAVKEFQPQAMIVQGDENRLHYVDGSGTVFAPVAAGQEIDLPVITGLDGFDTGEERAEMMMTALSFLRMAKRNNPNLPAQNVSEMHFTSEQEMILYLVEHPFPIYFGRGSIKRKYYQLWKVLEALYRKQKGTNMIDKIAYIRMDYQDNKVLVVQNNAG